MIKHESLELQQRITHNDSTTIHSLDETPCTEQYTANDLREKSITVIKNGNVNVSYD